MGVGAVVLPTRQAASKSAATDGSRVSRHGGTDTSNSALREDTSESSASEDNIARGDWVALVGQDADGGLQAWLARVVSTNHPDNLISLAYFPRVRSGPRAGQHERVWTPEWLEPRDCMSVLPPRSVEHLGEKFYKCSVDLSLFLTGVVSQDALQAAEAEAARPRPKPRKRPANKPAISARATNKKRAPSGSGRLTSRQSDMVSASGSTHSSGDQFARTAVDSGSDSSGEGGAWTANRALNRGLRRPDSNKAAAHPLQLARRGGAGDPATAAVVGGVLRDVGVSEFAVAGGGTAITWHTAHRQRQRKGPGGAITSVAMLGGVTNTFDGGAVGGSSTNLRRLMLQLKETAAHPEAYRNNLIGYAPLEQAGTHMLSQHLACSATQSAAAFRVVPSASGVPSALSSGTAHTLLAAGDSSSDDGDWGGGAVPDGVHGSPQLVLSSIAQGGARGVQEANGDGSAYLPGGAAWIAVQRASAKRPSELVIQGTDKMLRAEQGVPLNVPPPHVPLPPPYQLDVPGGSDRWPLMGVYRDLTANHARWGAEISLNGARYDLGVYACPAEAAAAYDNARLKAEGPVSSTNLGAARLMEGIVPSVFFGAQWAPQEARFRSAVRSRLKGMPPADRGASAAPAGAIMSNANSAVAASSAVGGGAATGAGPPVAATAPLHMPRSSEGGGLPSSKSAGGSPNKRARGGDVLDGGEGGVSAPLSPPLSRSRASSSASSSRSSSAGRTGRTASKRSRRK